MSNGCSLANYQAELIPGIDTITYGAKIGCPISKSSNQAGLFIPINDSVANFIYAWVDTLGKRIYRKALFEASIDFKNHLGLYKDKILVFDTILDFGLTAINKSKNSYWLVQPIFNKSGIYVLLYNDGKLIEINKFEIGYPTSRQDDGTGQLTFSPNGKLLAMYTPGIGLQLFDFDRSSGVISNFRYLGFKYNQSTFGGCCFSPDSRFVYISTPLEVLQIDLLEKDSTLMIDTVGVFDNFFDPYPATFLQMALGPDCRIYIATGGSNRYLHVITFPNNKGKTCGLINHGLKLLSRNAFAIPNNPHYRVNDPYPCDSTIKIQLSVHDFRSKIKS